MEVSDSDHNDNFAKATTSRSKTNGVTAVYRRASEGCMLLSIVPTETKTVMQKLPTDWNNFSYK